MNDVWNVWKHLNKKYDKIEEPERFLIAFGLATPVILLASINPFIGIPIILILVGARVGYLNS